MTAPVTVDLFTKTNCSFCDKAKAVLRDIDIPFVEHNIEESPRTAHQSVYFSGVSTVPQIFICGYHINGADDLEALHASGRLKDLLASLHLGGVALTDVSDEALAAGAEDAPLRDVIPQMDGTRDMDEENLPILHFYKALFGFWPATYRYLYQWREAYKTIALGHIMPTLQTGMLTVGPPLMGASAYSTANAHGCAYCTIHASGVGEGSVVRLLREAQDGRGGPDNPFGPFELALVDLAAKAALNTVAADDINQIRTLAGEAKGGAQDPEVALTGVCCAVAAMGFLNVFNDLTNLKVEGGLAAAASDLLDIDAGRHGATDANPNDLDFDIPETELSFEAVGERFDEEVGDLDDFAKRELGLAPNWLKLWPEMLRKRFAYVYAELMGERAHADIPGELKHLMARVSAVAKGHEAIAAAAAVMAHHAAADKTRAIARIEGCYAAAIAEADSSPLFTAKETAALRLAWLSAQTPLTTPRRFVQLAIDCYSPKQLVELIVACGLASAAQRVAAVKKPALDDEARIFCKDNDLEIDVLNLRYPLPIT